jgi:spore maturation protein CgeB
MKPPLRIACFGSSLVSAYWNGAATYYRGIFKALANLGYVVDFYEPDAYERQRHRDIPDPPWANVIVYSGTDPSAAFCALERARSSDVLIKTSGVGVFDELLEKAILEAARPHQSVVFWDVDAPATLARIAAHPGDPFRALIPRYDLVLTYGGGEPVLSGYRQWGARASATIYNALDPETHHPSSKKATYEADLSLLANRLPDREARIERFFFEPARRLPNKRFLLGGNGWHDRPLPANVTPVGHVYTDDHNAFNSSALAVLNVARDSMAENGYSPATRIFEAAGAGACIVTDAWLGIELFLEPDREILVAEDGAAVVDALLHLTPERAAAIGAAARRRVLAEHTYVHRAIEVAALFEGRAKRDVKAGAPPVFQGDVRGAS